MGDEAFEIAEALKPNKGEDDEQGLNASQLIAAEDLIKAINPPYDSGPARPSKVAHAVENLVRASIRKIEAEDD